MMKYFVVFFLTSGLTYSNAQSDFVVVELFTSQGCSSCPAADSNLSELLDNNQSKNIIGLSFHVDYWNYIGWKDPYSNKKFSERQRNYARMLNASVYTPQMIVNGKEVFVGSDKQKTRAAVAHRQPNKFDIKINSMEVSQDFATFNYTLDRVPKDLELNVALVERNIKNYVPRGENSGRTLHHDNVVRSFETLPLKKSSNIKIGIQGVVVENCAIVLYIQNQDNDILAAASYPLK